MSDRFNYQEIGPHAMNIEDPLLKMREIILNGKETKFYKDKFLDIPVINHSETLKYLISYVKQTIKDKKRFDIYMLHIHYYNYKDAYLYLQTHVDRLLKYNTDTFGQLNMSDVFGSKI